MFFEGSERKEAFLDHKNIGLKNHQNLQFFRGVSPWFLSKNGDFLIFSFYVKLIKKKCFVKVPKEEAFLDHKNIGSKKHQNLHFFKGVSRWFLSKNGNFLVFSFLSK